MKDTKNNALITLVSTQTSHGEEDCAEFTTTGSFYEKSGKYYILYNEHEDMGMGNSSVMLKADGDSVTMRRNGDFKTAMVYKKNETADVIYSMPFGEMKMKIKTENVENAMNSDGGELKFSYFLFVNGEESYNKISLKVKSERTDFE